MKSIALNNIMKHLTKHKQQLWGFIVLLVLAVSAAYLLFSVDVQTRTSIIAAVATALVAIFTLARQRQKDIDLKMREQKLPAYQNVLDLFKSLLTSIHEKENLSEKEVLRQYREINYTLIIGGSQSVVAKWSEYYKWMSTMADLDVPVESDLRPWLMRIKLAQVAREIRKDLGHNVDALSDEAIADLLLPLQQEAKEHMMQLVSRHNHDQVP